MFGAQKGQCRVMYAPFLWNPNAAALRRTYTNLIGIRKRRLFHSENAVTSTPCAARNLGFERAFHGAGRKRGSGRGDISGPAWHA